MSFFDFKDYRSALRELVSERKQLNSKFGFHSLADAARIQRPYMSKVMAGTADLNQDQLYLICESLKLDQDRTEFLCLLLDYERSGVASRKRKLKLQLENFAKRKHTFSETLNTNVVNPSSAEDLSAYYLNPMIQIVHVALSVPKFSKDPKLLASLLNLSTSEMQKILESLMTMRLVEYVQSEFRQLNHMMHLSKQSPLFHAWRSQIRMAGLQRQHSLSDHPSESYTAVFSATEDVRKSIHKRFLTFLKEFETEVSEAESRSVFQISYDLFKWV